MNLGRGSRAWLEGNPRRHLPWLVALLLLACSGPTGSPPQPAPSGSSAPVPALLDPALDGSAGPIPDFAPMDRIVTHSDLADMAPDLGPTLRRLIGASHVVDHRQAPDYDSEPGEATTTDDTLVWKRDYQPIYVRDHDGSVTALHYLAENPNRVMAPGHHAPWVQERVIPLIHENGNLVTTGRYVFVTEQLIDENAEPHSAPHLLRHGYRPRERGEVIRLLARHLHRKPDDIVVLPTMPYEATGHIDLYLLPLDEQSVMIPRIEDDALELLDEDRVRHIARVIQVFLDEQAAHLRELGVEVLRLPMIPPALGVWEEDHDRDIDGLFELLVFSPANALLVNLRDRRHVVLPGFSKVAEAPELAALIASYLQTWKEAFERRGWSPLVVDASELVAHLGLFRCVTASIPMAPRARAVEASRRRAALRPGRIGHPPRARAPIRAGAPSHRQPPPRRRAR